MSGDFFKDDQLGALRAIGESFQSSKRDEPKLLELANRIGKAAIPSCIRRFQGASRDVTWATRLLVEIARTQKQAVLEACDQYVAKRGENFDVARGLKYTLEAKLHAAGVYSEAKLALQSDDQAAALVAQLKWSNDGEILAFLDEFSFFYRAEAIELAERLVAEDSKRLSYEIECRIHSWQRMLGIEDVAREPVLDLAKEWMSEGDFESALCLTRIYLDDHPCDPYAHQLRASCFEFAGDLDMAYRHFSLASALKPSIAEWTWRAATCAHKIGKQGAAYRHFAQYLSQEDDALEAHFRRAVSQGFVDEYRGLAEIEYPQTQVEQIAYAEDLAFEAVHWRDRGDNTLSKAYTEAAQKAFPGHDAVMALAPIETKPAQIEAAAVIAFSQAAVRSHRPVRRRRQTVNG